MASPKVLAECLRRVMEDLSEEYWHAGWMSDWEYSCWLEAYHPEVRHGCVHLTDDERQTLRELHEGCGGWWVWGGHDVKFVLRNEWLEMFRERYPDKAASAR